MPIPHHNCAYCGQPDAASKCSRCKSSHYCGRACQSLDWKRHKAEDCRRPPSAAPSSNNNNYTNNVESLVAKYVKMQEDIDALVERNRGVIVEVHNCATFLSAANDMIGKEGPTSFKFEIRRDVVSAKPANMADMMMLRNISKRIMGVPIGQKGAKVTLEDIISMLQSISNKRHKDNQYIEYSIDLLLAVKGMLKKKEGPCYFEHGIVTASNKDARLDGARMAAGSPVVKPGAIGYNHVNATGELLRIPIGKSGKNVSVEDVIAAFYKVSTHVELEKFRKSGRSYLHEGFRLSGNGKTLTMVWGS